MCYMYQPATIYMYNCHAHIHACMCGSTWRRLLELSTSSVQFPAPMGQYLVGGGDVHACPAVNARVFPAAGYAIGTIACPQQTNHLKGLDWRQVYHRNIPQSEFRTTEF